ncbi:hypothetical protein CEUSTIGMA_g1180.t1 [Chlamydomonas eustigma]|uniref:Uncharacterized protein n=1 Tax=Chlamydomonas eustigma TaxID=1157962 RepID=A0A250WSA8_9CHLO|nr:hypothetical protein CEUSTIGMA_g1180.t1 [Chlamydomonas eustigma]|eukprot:GAX73727.1 hypothetical protein CEUSTIGMA_g1180.t1 [Chlamydomonas eustigma]
MHANLLLPQHTMTVLEGLHRGSSSERTSSSKLKKFRKTVSKLLGSSSSRKSQLDDHVRSSPSVDNGFQKPSSIAYSATSSGGAHVSRKFSSAAPIQSKSFLEDQLSALRGQADEPSQPSSTAGSAVPTARSLRSSLDENWDMMGNPEQCTLDDGQSDQGSGSWKQPLSPGQPYMPSLARVTEVGSNTSLPPQSNTLFEREQGYELSPALEENEEEGIFIFDKTRPSPPSYLQQHNQQSGRRQKKPEAEDEAGALRMTEPLYGSLGHDSQLPQSMRFKDHNSGNLQTTSGGWKGSYMTSLTPSEDSEGYVSNARAGPPSSFHPSRTSSITPLRSKQSGPPEASYYQPPQQQQQQVWTGSVLEQVAQAMEASEDYFPTSFQYELQQQEQRPMQPASYQELPPGFRAGASYMSGDTMASSMTSRGMHYGSGVRPVSSLGNGYMLPPQPRVGMRSRRQSSSTSIGPYEEQQTSSNMLYDEFIFRDEPPMQGVWGTLGAAAMRQVYDPNQQQQQGSVSSAGHRAPVRNNSSEALWRRTLTRNQPMLTSASGVGDLLSASPPSSPSGSQRPEHLQQQHNTIRGANLEDSQQTLMTSPSSWPGSATRSTLNPYTSAELETMRSAIHASMSVTSDGSWPNSTAPAGSLHTTGHGAGQSASPAGALPSVFSDMNGYGAPPVVAMGAPITLLLPPGFALQKLKPDGQPALEAPLVPASASQLYWQDEQGQLLPVAQEEGSNLSTLGLSAVPSSELGNGCVDTGVAAVLQVASLASSAAPWTGFHILLLISGGVLVTLNVFVLAFLLVMKLMMREIRQWPGGSNSSAGGLHFEM